MRNLRHLRHAPGFTVTAVLTLAAAIGVVVAMVSVYTRVVLRPVWVDDPDSLVSLYATNPNVNFVPPTLSWPKSEAIRREATQFVAMGAYSIESVNLSLPDGAGAEQVRALRISDGFAETVGLSAAHGRLFQPAEDVPNGPAVCVLSHEFWMSRFGGRDIVGTMIDLNDTATEVVGVLPPGLSPPWADRQVFVPRVFEDSGFTRQAVQDGASFLNVVARLGPGATRDLATAELRRVSENYARAFVGRGDAQSQTEVRTLAESVTGSRGPALLMLLGAVAAVLLIACANVAAMFLNRLLSRRREFIVRQALGASRAMIVRQLLGESLALALMSGVAGLLIGWLVIRLAQAVLGRQLPPGVELGLAPWAVVTAVGVALLCALLVGLVPALHVTRGNAVSGVAGSDRGLSDGAGTRAFRFGLVVVETSLSVVLLVAASLFVLSLDQLHRTSPGFQPAGVSAAFSNLTSSRYATPEQRAGFFLGVVEQLQASAQVSAAAVVFGLPFHDENYAHTYAVRGRPLPPSAERPRAGLRIVSEDYFAVMGIRLVEGRLFTAADRVGAPLVCILNETAARRAFGGRSPLGEVMLRGIKGDVEHEVVGVVADVKTNGLRNVTPDEIFYPFRQGPRANAALVARTTGDPAQLGSVFRVAAAVVDPAQPLSRLAPMEDRLADTLGVERMMSALTGAFAGGALLLALTGLVAVLAHAVAGRRVEIGIRMAVGADRRAIVRLILGEGMRMVSTGIAIGLLLAVAVSGLLSAHLFGVEARDPLTFAGVAVLFGCVGAVASLAPALHAARVDPITSIRSVS